MKTERRNVCIASEERVIEDDGSDMNWAARLMMVTR